IGESQVRKVDVRVVAATHRDLRHMVGQGLFREDLYFRLSVMAIDLPPLRERGDDVVMLAEKFLEDFTRTHPNIVKPRLGDAAKEALMAGSFPGNVRQLKNVIQRAAHLCRSGVIEPADLHLGRREDPRSMGGGEGRDRSVEGFDSALFDAPFKDAKQSMVDAFERAYFSRLLDRTDGNLSRAAAEAGITRYYLRELLKRLGMHRSQNETG